MTETNYVARTRAHIGETPYRMCKPCERFQELGFKCSAATHLECDCPKCQGFCKCGDTDVETAR